MRQYERNGVTIDQCTDCRGVFLDRGELERLIDAENAWNDARVQQPAPHAPPPPQPQQQYYQQQHQRPYKDYDSDEYPVYNQHGQKRKKRGGFLEDLFD